MIADEDTFPDEFEMMKRHSDTRNRAIEECARVAETWDYGWGDSAACDGIAAAIRALKDKP